MRSESRIDLGSLIGKKRFTLASKSSRRSALLKEAGIDFQIKAPKVNEKKISSNPREHVLTLSKMKAASVLSLVKSGLVLGADTIVVLDGEILGKPGHRKGAVLMLKKLRNREHKVYTGLTLMDKESGQMISDCECTKVKFKFLSDEDIDDYVSSGEPKDKAGAYGIQGRGGRLVEKINGPLDNVIGLPMEKLRKMIDQMLRK